MGTPLVDVAIVGSETGGYVLNNGTGEMCFGTAKLVQNVLMELLTEVGSKQYNPEAGTVFLKVLKSKSVCSEFDVSAAFTASASDIRQKFKLEETIDTPAEERLVSLTLSNITLLQDNVLLTIKIVNGAGTVTDVATAAGVIF